MLYLDTSLLVAVLTQEIHTDRIKLWLSEQDVNDLVISDWVMTEFSSALSIKLRTGQIDTNARADALAMFASLYTDSLSILPVTGLQFREAARFADQFSLGLRGADALHLAICAGQGAALCTLDKRLAEAGPALGVKTVLL
jgi:predicted nucleic acid-binding protein